MIRLYNPAWGALHSYHSAGDVEIVPPGCLGWFAPAGRLLLPLNTPRKVLRIIWGLVGLCNAVGCSFRVYNSHDNVGSLSSGVFGMVDLAGGLVFPNNPPEDAGRLCSGVLSLFDPLAYSKRMKPSKGVCMFSTMEVSVT